MADQKDLTIADPSEETRELCIVHLTFLQGLISPVGYQKVPGRNTVLEVPLGAAINPTVAFPEKFLPQVIDCLVDVGSASFLIKWPSFLLDFTSSGHSCCG